MQRPQRRELGLQPPDHRLVEPLRRRQVLQPVLTEIEQADRVVDLTRHELRGALRQQHLASVRGAHDARRVVDVDSGIEPFRLHGLARVQPDPDSDRL